MTDQTETPTGPGNRLRKKKDRSHLRDVIYGAIDGAVTTFAIVAGVVGADLSTRVIVALGIANVLADGFSMAAGNYSGTKAELDDARRLREIVETRIRLTPDDARAELKGIMAEKGLTGATLDTAAMVMSRDHGTWVDTILVERYGVSPNDPHPMRAAQATFGAFLVAGMVPLLPYLLALPDPFTWSIGATGLTFFAVGAMKSAWSLASWWRSGIETLLIGGCAAAIAYVVGTFFA